MNQLNEIARTLRVMIDIEKKKETPDKQRLETLKKQYVETMEQLE